MACAYGLDTLTAAGSHLEEEVYFFNWIILIMQELKLKCQYDSFMRLVFFNFSTNPQTKRVNVLDPLQVKFC